MFITATTSLLTTLALSGLPTTVTVGPSGTYVSIADAVLFIEAEDSVDGYIIEVEDGTYLIDEDSDIRINTLAGPLTIQSVDGTGTVVIDGDNTFQCLWAKNTDLTLIGLTLQNGTATDDGGGVYTTNGSLTLEHVEIHDCEALDYGGGVYAYSMDALTVTDCSFTDCIGGRGGGVLVQATTTSISATDFTRCTATSSGHGGGLYLSSPDGAVGIDATTFQDCTAGFGGGLNTYSEMTLTNCQFLRCNSNFLTGGGINASNCTIACTSCTFEDNSSVGNGGAISVVKVDLTALNCSFTGNSAPSGAGGGVSCFGGSAELTDCTIQNNSAINGAGLWFKTFNDATAMTVNISNCTLHSNTATANGGHVYYEIWSSGYGGMAASLTDSTLSEGTANTGGALDVIGTGDPLELHISGCTLSNNTATTAISPTDAIAVSGSTADVTITSSVACDHGFERELDTQVIDGGGNDLGGWCCPGDVDDSGSVDSDDLTAFLAAWGNSSDGNDREDIDRDEAVIMLDLIEMFRNWGMCS